MRRDPPGEKFQEAVEYLKSRGFKFTFHRFGPKTRVDLSWPDDRHGIRLPEWRVVEIAEELRREGEASAGSTAAPAAREARTEDSEAPAPGP